MVVGLWGEGFGPRESSVRLKVLGLGLYFAGFGGLWVEGIGSEPPECHLNPKP